MPITLAAEAWFVYYVVCTGRAGIKRNKFAAVPAVIDMYLSVALTISSAIFVRSEWIYDSRILNFKCAVMNATHGFFRFSIQRWRSFSDSSLLCRIRRFDCLAGMCTAAAEWIYSTNKNSWLNRFRWMCRYSPGGTTINPAYFPKFKRASWWRAGVDWVALIRSISACLSCHSME